MCTLASLYETYPPPSFFPQLLFTPFLFFPWCFWWTNTNIPSFYFNQKSLEQFSASTKIKHIFGAIKTLVLEVSLLYPSVFQVKNFSYFQCRIAEKLRPPSALFFVVGKLFLFCRREHKTLNVKHH